MLRFAPRNPVNSPALSLVIIIAWLSVAWAFRSCNTAPEVPPQMELQ